MTIWELQVIQDVWTPARVPGGSDEKCWRGTEGQDEEGLDSALRTGEATGGEEGLGEMAVLRPSL